MPIPESTITSPDVEITDPQWCNVLPAQRYLAALVAYHNGKISIVELDQAKQWMMKKWGSLPTMVENSHGGGRTWEG